jgi:hypothetical protein
VQLAAVQVDFSIIQVLGKMEDLEEVDLEEVVQIRLVVMEYLVKDLLVVVADKVDVAAAAVEEVILVEMQVPMTILQDLEEMERLDLIA